MSNINWKEEMPLFKEKTDAFYAGELKANEYKGFSGFYGSYAQKGGKASMLRLRMSAGRISKEKLRYVVDMANKYNVDPIHFTTCQAIQFHNLNKEAVYDIMENAVDVNIITFGGGGDFPRNVMCSPLSGVSKNEKFDVMPYALSAADYLLNFIKATKMPRKLKVAFSSDENNYPHATFRDLGFVANENGNFDVYCCGGLGNNPRLGVNVAKDVIPFEFRYYIKAMWLTFLAHGNYENRAKARTRYMVEAVGGEENFKAIYLEKLAEAKKEDLFLQVSPIVINKEGKGYIEGRNIIEQKQPGLFAVHYHPVGGKPNLEVLTKLCDAIEKMDDVEVRLCPDEGCYIINLTAKEAEIVNSIVDDDNAHNDLEESVSCIGATICQVGLRDSQGLLRSILKRVKEEGVKDNALPKLHISGCTSSCGTHQTAPLSFRGGIKVVDKKPVNAFVLYLGGNDVERKEILGKEIGAIEETRIPDFVIEVARYVENKNVSFMELFVENPEFVEEIAQKYVK